MYTHKKIAITGGPCAGKTTAMQKIVQEFTEKGYKVFVVSETATDLINGGIKPFGDDPINILDFQRCIMDAQLFKEKLFENIANATKKDTLILCDRGVFDNKAYITANEFKDLLKERNLNEMELISTYDLVIHLVTAADGAVEFYTLANNSARTETPEEAIQKDKKTLNSWLGHKKIEIIANEGSFDEKIHNVTKVIYEFLGKPYPIQRQYKFLIDKVDFDKLNELNPVKLKIEQFFTDIGEDENTMVRKTTKDGDSTYNKTIKKDTDVQNEKLTTTRRIEEREYNELLKDNNDKPIRKSRWCFTYNNQYYRLDIFKDIEGLMILEAELTNQNKSLEIPDCFSIKEDITTNKEYRNVSLYNKLNNRD